MTWGWTAISKTRYRYDAIWTVERHGGRWYAYRGGSAMLADFADAGAAMVEAAVRQVRMVMQADLA